MLPVDALGLLVVGQTEHEDGHLGLGRDGHRLGEEQVLVVVTIPYARGMGDPGVPGYSPALRQWHIDPRGGDVRAAASLEARFAGEGADHRDPGGR